MPAMRGREVVAQHLAELVGLALDAERRPLDLLVVFELQLEQTHHVDGRAGSSGDRDARVPIGREHLLDRAVADPVARRRTAVARHHHAVGVAHGDARGAVRDRRGAVVRRRHRRRLQSDASNEAREIGTRVIGRGERRQHVAYSPPFWM
jgi:hypothetical protein